MSLPSLATYKGPPLPEKVEQLLASLQSMGFAVSPSGGENKTIRVQWGTAYVGYVNKTVLDHKALLGYRFNATSANAQNACPTDFDVESFAANQGCSPFALDVHENSGKKYLHILSEGAVITLLQRSIGKICDEAEVNSRDTEIEADLKTIESDASISETTRTALIHARVGQGKFRADLLKQFGNQCAVTGLRLPRLLRASHIKPWRLANNSERLDPNNGLLLSPNVDALFDDGLVTFDEHGHIYFSPRLTPVSFASLGPIGNLLLPPTPQQASYLLFHAQEVFR